MKDQKAIRKDLCSKLAILNDAYRTLMIRSTRVYNLRIMDASKDEKLNELEYLSDIALGIGAIRTEVQELIDDLKKELVDV